MRHVISAPMALSAAIAAAFIAVHAGGAFAQSKPAGTAAPPAAAPAVSPDAPATRGLSVRTAPAPVMAPDVMESRPGGCPEGPPCPGTDGAKSAAPPPEDCGEGKDCPKPE